MRRVTQLPRAARNRVVRVGAALHLFAAAFAAASCSEFLGPGAGTHAFVLTSIGGVALDSTVNLYLRCEAGFAARGAELYMLSDSLFFRPNGRLERRYRWRWRAEVVSRPTPDYPAQTDLHRDFYSYVRRGNEFLVATGGGAIVYPPGADGAITLDDGYCGDWRFERAAP